MPAVGEASNRTARPAVAVVVAVAGILAALALPFAPVAAQHTDVTWPAAGRPTTSSAAQFVPYRPDRLEVSVPCSVLRAAADRGETVNVLATGLDGQGLALRIRAGNLDVLLGGRPVAVLAIDAVGDCATHVLADSDGVTISAAGRDIVLPGEPVPEVFAFRTDLDPDGSAGMTVGARIASPFSTRPSVTKLALIGVSVLAALVTLNLLPRNHSRYRRRSRPGWPGRAAVDAGVIAVLGIWAIVGPLAVDDGWAATIARNVAASGNAGNYYRWWNASEAPFALSQHLLSVFTQVSLAPLWLRVPSTLLALATWFCLSRLVLPTAAPAMSRKFWCRALAALFFLLAWLPFNLGTRPESYVAFGVTLMLAVLWRARSPAALGMGVLVAGITVAVGPTSVILAAPLAVFAPRSVRLLRRFAQRRAEMARHALMLACVGSVALIVIFADQTWHGLVTATDWHSTFGPSLPWYREPDRYAYLLGDGQQGSSAKRLPVLLSVAMLPVVAALYACRVTRDRAGRSAARLALTLALAFAVLSVSPSKWSYHLGALAGLIAAFLAVAVTLFVSLTRIPGRRATTIAVLGGLLMAGAATLAFAGPNAWWLPVLYDVPWAKGTTRPLGVPLDSPIPWLIVLGLAGVVGAARRGRPVRAGLVAVPVTAAVIMLALLVTTFSQAPLRRPQASLALVNLRWLSRTGTCGLADHAEVLADRETFAAASPSGPLGNFAEAAGFHPGSPPPDPVGAGNFVYVWGSYSQGPRASGTMTSPWFALPPLGPSDGVALTVSGRTGDANQLVLEFGRADPVGVTSLAEISPADRLPEGEDTNHPSWRAVGVDQAAVPAGADRVRIRATDRDGWLAFSGPRRRTAVPMTAFLDTHGPVLVSWPQSFLFPCVRNIAGVADGLAQMPRTQIVSPGPWLTEPTDEHLGGTFVGMKLFGRVYELPVRIDGRADLDWGTLLVSGSEGLVDAYDREQRRAAP